MRLAAKAEPQLIADDERQFAAIAASIEETIADLSDRLDRERAAPGGTGQAAMDRDLEIHRLTARLRALRRFSLDLCLGRFVYAEGTEPAYVGRLGLTDGDGRRLLIDWRSPAAEPFFAATHAQPLGLATRRRYRWTRGQITDYWDEVFTPDAEVNPALDDHSAFIAGLGADRSDRMRDVLGTIQADQDAIIRAGAPGALVVEGGPGTGKTVVALHRTAYLLYREPRLRHSRSGVLFVGPHQPYLAYVADVLPSLGEEGVLTCTVRDLVAEAADAGVETDPRVATLKSSGQWMSAIEAAVRFYEEPPTEAMTVSIESADLEVSVDDWVDAFDAGRTSVPHNEARDLIWDQLLTILLDKYDGDDAVELVRASLLRDDDLRTAVNRGWPLIEAGELVADLWAVPAYLRKCAPWLTADERGLLRRTEGLGWTEADLPLLDAARQRLGDPQTAVRQRQRRAVVAAEREQLVQVVEDLLTSLDSREPMVNLRRDVLATIEEPALARDEQDRFAGPFGHIVVDEAQELTDAQWQMLLSRCPSRSFTIVGDRAQARHGFTESWHQRLKRIGLDRITLATLTVNYRTPEEIMAAAEPVIRAVLPDANVPTSIRSTGVPVESGSVADLTVILQTWLDTHADGIACVIGAPTFIPITRVQSLPPELVKGLEFDLVILVDPTNFGTGVSAAVDRYVAMTRATQRLVILTS